MFDVIIMLLAILWVAGFGAFVLRETCRTTKKFKRRLKKERRCHYVLAHAA
jgi:hypothetical protein